MKISIITVSYNSEKTIRQTFESLKKQKIDGFQLECIHIDGLSQDSTMKIASEYADFITSISEKDTGIYDAMNKGIALSTGDIVGILNSDDIYASSDILFKIVAAFKNNPDCDVVYGNIIMKDFNMSKTTRLWKSSKYQSSAFVKGWHPPHPSFFVKKSVYSEIGGFDTNLRIAADFDFMLRVLEIYNYKSVFINEVLTLMRSGGTSNNSIRNIIEGNKDVISAFEKYGISINPAIYILKRLIPKLSQYKRLR